jgi:hypothetical protein
VEGTWRATRAAEERTARVRAERRRERQRGVDFQRTARSGADRVRRAG